MVSFLPYSPNSKVRCPQCGKPKRLTLFINLNTGEIYPPEFGVCDRIQACGYNKRPDKKSQLEQVKLIPKPPKPIDYLDIVEVEKRMSNNAKNHFFEFLKNLIGKEGMAKVREQYKLGTSLIHPGFVTFPQIDTEGRLRQIQEVLYNPKTGERNKKKGSQRWGFEKWKYPNLNLEMTYFGSHLITGNDKPIAIVESAKTAIIASHFIPSYNWVASISLGMLSNERCKSLKGRNVVLFPDLGAEPIWKKKAKYIKGMTSIKVSDYLNKNSKKYNLNNGDDLADLILKQ
ncbi:DUF6371 domain-containing protein [Maribacter sp. 1_2014MBL_MicDiv]|uniref:DUF6371 domain-containing protein n=1 Tax=Maribacter sp. 1_2014MBL_MicDiv TaxID=1644130 RepID=UPI0008F4E871|nr:DUF6371 domain-containing protein [Maribacter sp. 1_2014MBL_MicDiv]APA65649.1 hypothetical protein YQ22_15805 [Maribacter sp. 1_2014MBL_MicDiv]